MENDSDNQVELGGENNPNDDSNLPMNREQVHALVSNRLAQFRPLAWEDDVSRNSLDNVPFVNHPPISQRLEQVLGLQSQLVKRDEVEKLAAEDLAPIPSPDDREGYSAKHDGKYWFSGLRDYYCVMDVVQKYAISVNRLMDFGCASGRVLRHFAVQSKIQELWGTDINARHIRWLCEFMPMKVKPIANHCLPQLPIADEYFDVITAFSVFTHIDTFETCWLAELKRVLAPDGLAYVTIHNEDTWRLLGQEINNEDNRLVQSMMSVDSKITENLQKEMPTGRTIYRFTHRGPYRSQVFHSNSYVKNVWGRFFDIVEILPCHHARQSVVVMRHNHHG